MARQSAEGGAGAEAIPALKGTDLARRSSAGAKAGALAGTLAEGGARERGQEIKIASDLRVNLFLDSVTLAR